MTTVGDELTNSYQRHSIQVTRDDEIGVDVPLPEETAEMSGEKSQGWITEEAFFAVSPGARQVRQRKEVKMKQLSLAEINEFLKSTELE